MFDGAGIVNLTNDPAYDREPTWTPDGTTIACASVLSNNFDIRVTNSDGTGKVTLTTSPGNDYEPDWQPIVQIP
jgi:TolB protein